jgi:hypothetical protein
MTIVIDGTTGISPVTASGTSASVDGMTVGRGGGEVSTATVVGNLAGNSNVSGGYLTAIGYGAGRYVTGDGITAIGYSALNSSSSATNCTALGAFALTQNTTAGQNTAVGYQAGYNVNGSSYSVFVGSRTGSNGASVITGNYHTCVGDASGYSLQGASTNNALFGQNAGSSITTGSKNTVIGSYTGSAAPISATGSNFVVLSDGDGNIVASTKTAQTFALQGGTLSSGTGIAFPATQSASTNANTLDDYEEGTWTPTDGSGSGLTIAVTGAYYRKVGSIVFVNCYITYPATSSSNQATISGLPYTSLGAQNYSYIMGRTQNNLGNMLAWQVNSGSNQMAGTLGWNSVAGVTNANVSGSYILVSGCYIADN